MGSRMPKLNQKSGFYESRHLSNDPLPRPIGELQGHAKQYRKVNHGTA